MAPNQDYGAGQSSGRQANGDADESAPLLTSRKPTDSSTTKRLRGHLHANVDEAWADLILLVGYVITGLLDSSSTNIWGAFVSMQTGNTVYVGLGIADPTKSTRWIRSMVSIVSFCLGSFCFSLYHRTLGAKRRYVLVLSYTFQTFLIIAAALMVMFGQTEGNDLHWHVLIPLAFVAFQSSGQAVTSRALHYNSMTSVVLTSIYCDLFGDPKLFTGISQNAERNRRIAAPVLLLLGAIAGGVFARSGVGLAGALWLAAALKTGIIIAWFFWKQEPAADRE